jgi:hypothetical protein
LLTLADREAFTRLSAIATVSDGNTTTVLDLMNTIVSILSQEARVPDSPAVEFFLSHRVLNKFYQLLNKDVSARFQEGFLMAINGITKIGHSEGNQREQMPNYMEIFKSACLFICLSVCLHSHDDTHTHTLSLSLSLCLSRTLSLSLACGILSVCLSFCACGSFVCCADFVLSNNTINNLILFPFNKSQDGVRGAYVQFLKSLANDLNPRTMTLFHNEVRIVKDCAPHSCNLPFSLGKHLPQFPLLMEALILSTDVSCLLSIDGASARLACLRVVEGCVCRFVLGCS